MRDWCFRKDFLRFQQQRNQVAEGGPDAQSNEKLVEILMHVVSNPATPFSQIRNVIFLVGARAKRLSDDSVKSLMTIINQRVQESKNKEEDASEVWRALFELARQQFLQDTKLEDEVSETQRVSTFTQHSRELAETIIEYRESSWDAYFKQDLEVYSHSLDLRPKPDSGWKTILPQSWLNQGSA